jgi:hypothetical protein
MKMALVKSNRKLALYKLDAKTKNVSFSIDDENVCEVFSACLAHCKEKSSELKAQILKALIESANSYAVNPTDEEAMKKLENYVYAAEICSEIDKYSL